LAANPITGYVLAGVGRGAVLAYVILKNREIERRPRTTA
jgi:hypothetical protein